MLRAESPSAAEALRAQLATLDLADSTMMLGTDQNGRFRSIRNITEGEVDTGEPVWVEATMPKRKSALTEAEAAHYIGMSAA